VTEPIALLRPVTPERGVIFLRPDLLGLPQTPRATSHFIKCGYRKSAEICGILEEQSPINHDIDALIYGNGRSAMATEIPVKARELDGSMLSGLMYSPMPRTSFICTRQSIDSLPG
jgi:hypothetical protein